MGGGRVDFGGGRGRGGRVEGGGGWVDHSITSAGYRIAWLGAQGLSLAVWGSSAAALGPQLFSEPQYQPNQIPPPATKKNASIQCSLSLSLSHYLSISRSVYLSTYMHKKHTYIHTYIHIMYVYTCTQTF